MDSNALNQSSSSVWPGLYDVNMAITLRIVISLVKLSEIRLPQSPIQQLRMGREP